MDAVLQVPRDHRIPTTETSHPDNPVPEEPQALPEYIEPPDASDRVWDNSYVTYDSNSPTESEGPDTPQAIRRADLAVEEGEDIDVADIMSIALPPFKRRRASTRLLTSNPQDVRRMLGDEDGTKMVGRVCCGGGCCFLSEAPLMEASDSPLLASPDNDAFRSLSLKVGHLCLDTKLTNIADLPDQTVFLEKLDSAATAPSESSFDHPPAFVTPHHPYQPFSARVHDARGLTRPGAEKRTYHFDLDVTGYPEEGGNVDFVVGGAIGVCPSNPAELVDGVFNTLGVPKFVRDKQVRCRTTSGRWPTIWGDDMPRELVTTRRELLTWCSDLQSYAPTKPLLRLLAEYATEPTEKKILTYLVSAQGQASFCDLRTGPHVTVLQLLDAFPSAKPSLDHLLSVLNTLMPRFYSLSHDPQVSCEEGSGKNRRLIEIAVTIHEVPDYHGGVRTGVGSGFLERVAQDFINGQSSGTQLDIRVPMFRGLMANPLAKEFVSDGPMLLVGAGVGIAPFRGFVQRRLKSANCANKVWVLQGIRDSLVDELYRGEWGVEEEQVKKVIQSRRGKGRYVQDEVRHQADLVWFIINSIDGRIFVCGSTQGMGEGVEAALVDVAMEKGNLNHEEALAFWKQKKDEGQYVAETW